MKNHPLPVLAVLCAASVLPLSTQARSSGASSAGRSGSIVVPSNPLSAAVQQQAGAEASTSVEATKDGAVLRAVMQDLEGEATSQGLWLVSKSEEDKGGEGRLMVRAIKCGRGEGNRLPERGEVRVAGDAVAWTRPGLVEEYRVSTDGVRQDFVVAERPDGKGELTVALEVRGARAESADYGAKLVLDGTGRELAYHKLAVTDARGQALKARMEVADAGSVVLRVEDETASYPVRIDPTFSDADWISMNTGGISGASYRVNAIVSDDRGNIYIGGDFLSAGNFRANNIARWNGNQWLPMGGGASFLREVDALAVDSQGNVYAGGDAASGGGGVVAKWDSFRAQWVQLGEWFVDESSGVGFVSALALDKQGNLYAAGGFTICGNIAVSNIAKWDGGRWSPLGAGLDNRALALAVDSNRNLLYAAGWFAKAGGKVVSGGIAKWNGSTWTALGTNGFGSIDTLAVDGSGNLYAGGGNAAGIVKWNGSAWSSLNGGVADTVTSLAADSQGNVYAVSGISKDKISKWNGSTWTALGTDINDQIRALEVDKSGNVYAGGLFTRADGNPVGGVAKWNGRAFSALGSGIDGPVNAFARDGKGNIYVGGDFRKFGALDANGIAKWDGNNWSSLNGGVDGPVTSLVVDIRGALYVGGSFGKAGGTVFCNGIAQWASNRWTSLGAAGDVKALAVDSQGKVYAACKNTDGFAVSDRVMRWGGLGWDDLDIGGYLAPSFEAQYSFPPLVGVNALAVTKTGTLLVGGVYENYDQPARDAQFSNSDYVVAENGFVLSWDGAKWTKIYRSIGVKCLLLGTNGMVYVGGFQHQEGRTTIFTVDPETGEELNSVDRFDEYYPMVVAMRPDGSSAEHLRLSGYGNFVTSLAQDAQGNLIIGGDFKNDFDGKVALNGIARWDGKALAALGSGLAAGEFSCSVHSLLPDETGGFFVGGDFFLAGGKGSPYLARVDLRGSQSITFAQPANQVFSPNRTLVFSASASSKLPVVLSSANTNVVAIAGNVATIKGAGAVKITATQAGNVNFKPAADVVRTITIAKGSQTITFPQPVNQVYGPNKTFPVVATAGSGLPVSLSSANSNIVTFSGTTATIKAAGTVAVTARQSGDLNYNAASNVVRTITIAKAPQTITFTLPGTNAFKTNGLIPLNGKSSSGLPVAYTSAKPGILQIVGTNAVMKGRGTNTITASQTGNANYKAATNVTRTIIIR